MKTLTANSLSTHVNQAVQSLSSLLSDFIKREDPKHDKKASLISYWIKSYVSYLRREDAFNPKEVFRLKRGQVVQADFGFRIGRELGGLHYAVVLDNDNKLSSPVVTVVPLMSLKQNYTPNNYTRALEDGIFQTCIDKLSEELCKNQELTQRAIELERRRSSEAGTKNSQLVLECENCIEKSIRNITSFQNKLDDMHYLKSGSVAAISQITTISKMRIKKPLAKNDLLYNVRLSSKDMDVINTAIKKLYIF